MKHELKILPQYYCRVADGSKTFEIRKNDRGFQPGDVVVLREWSEEWDYKGSTDLKFTIGYVLPIDAERVVFSLLKKDSTDDKK
jgi:hypothetical protein